MPLPDYYAMLGVPSDATLTQIKQSYRRLARVYHPDVNKQAPDTHIKQLNEAYDVLSDTVKRAAYDIKRLEEMRQRLILEVLLQQRQAALREPRMTWADGVKGFVREFKKGMKEA